MAVRLVSGVSIGPDMQYACTPLVLLFDSDTASRVFSSEGARKLVRALENKRGSKDWALPTCQKCAALLLEAISIRAAKVAGGT